MATHGLMVRTVAGLPRSCDDAFLFDRPVNAKAAGIQVGLLRKEKEHDRVVFQAQVGAEFARAFVLGETVRDRVQNDGNVDITVRRQLTACARAVEIYATQSVTVDSGQALAPLAAISNACSFVVTIPRSIIAAPPFCDKMTGLPLVFFALLPV